LLSNPFAALSSLTLVKVLVERLLRRPSGDATGIIAKFRYEVKPCFVKTFTDDKMGRRNGR
jgi:hypothetical protein